MNRSDWVIVWLSLQVSFISWSWLQAEKRASYLSGRLNAFIDSARAEDGEPFDCAHQPCEKKGK